MTFKVGETPSARANRIEHADFLEIECLRQTDLNASGGDLLAAISRIDDDLPEERSRSDMRMDALVHEVFDELTDRARHSGAGPYTYPFHVDGDSQLLRFNGKKGQRELYLFMLFATRINMGAKRVQDGIDGTHLFEEICCEVAKNYWGNRTDGIVFGTSRRRAGSEVGGFTEAINDLCNRLGEGIGFYSPSGARPTAQDGKLDIVVWKQFTDKRQGQLIGFGQCKTGTHWEDGKFELHPEGFCKKWVRTAPAVNPVRLFFISSRPNNHQWFETSVDAGIVFDRCRILDYAPRMTVLEGQWQKWLKAALLTNDIKGL